MYKLIKFLLLVSAVTLAGSLQVWASDNQLLPSGISDYGAFFNEHYRLAVDGNATSQLYIGALYEKGLGVQKDLTLSHVYYNLASATGAKNAKQQRKRIEKLLSKEEFAEARKLAKLFKKGTGIDHPRQTSSLNIIPEIAKDETQADSKRSETKTIVSTSDDDIYSNFFNAVINNDTAQIKNLVSSGIDVNHRFSDGKTALMLASEFGYLSTVGTLLDSGANANLRDSNNRTALKIAQDSGHGYIAAVLRTKTLAPKKLVKDIQTYLARLEYNPGPVDGLYGPRTQRALRQFSTDYSQNHPIAITEQQLETLKTAYSTYITKKTNELKLLQSMQLEAEKTASKQDGEKKPEHSSVSVSATSTENKKQPSSDNTVETTLVTDDLQNTSTIDDETITKKFILKKIGKYPDITGTYNAQTSAVFSKCGAYNKKIKYHAEETIKNLKENGKFEISYLTPLLNCSGKGKFTSDVNVFKGKYDCTYKTTGGFQGTLTMKIVGTITEDKIEMKYHGSDTTPGQACIYDWWRTLTLKE